MGGTLRINSETGRLRRVVVHTPGEEVEAMRPSRAEEELYNDIVPLEIVRKQHAELKGFLSKVADVVEFGDALAETLEDAEAREEFAILLAESNAAAHRLEELKAMAPADLAAVALAGLPSRHVRLGRFVRGEAYDIPPLPNMFFMRDAAMVFRDRSISSAMRFAVRRPEAAINRFAFSRHPSLRGGGGLFDGPSLAGDGFSLEGGDFQVIRRDTVAIGVSERTSADAVDELVRSIVDAFGEPVTVFAVILPVARATIHLDMAFTVIDDDACLVYEPVILGPRRSRTIKIQAEPGKEPRLSEVDSLLRGLRQARIDLEPVLTGGSDPLRQEREQWLSGANSFAYAPGKIIVYSCNVHTLEALSKSGFEVRSAADYLSGNLDPMEPRRVAVGFDGVELARGGGGARCMTCPIERDD